LEIKREERNARKGEQGNTTLMRGEPSGKKSRMEVVVLTRTEIGEKG